MDDGRGSPQDWALQLLQPLRALVVGLLAGALLLLLRLVFDQPAEGPLPPLLVLGALAVADRGRQVAGLAAAADGGRGGTAAGALGALGAVVVLGATALQVGALLLCVRFERGTAALVLAVAAGSLALVLARALSERWPRWSRAALAVLGTGVAVLVAAYEVWEEHDRFTRGARVVNAVRPVVALAVGLGLGLLVARRAVRAGVAPAQAVQAAAAVATTATLVVMAANLPYALQQVSGWYQTYG